jgi:GT2 family glycosyltransferase
VRGKTVANEDPGATQIALSHPVSELAGSEASPIEGVSLCIASYAGGRRLERLFASLAAAGVSGTDEVLVWDDGSPAEGAAAIQAAVDSANIAAEESPGWVTTLYRTPERWGWPRGHAHLAARASRKILLQLDDDVVLPVGFMPLLRDLIALIPNVGALSWRTEGPRRSDWNSARGVPGYLELACNLAGTCTAFWRSVYDAVGGMDTKFEFCFADSDLPLRMMLAGHPCYRVWWPLVWHEENASSRESPELPRPAEVAKRDIVYWNEKWGGRGPAAMEEIALARLRDRAEH